MSRIKVLFFDDKDEPQPLEFDGATGDFFRGIRDAFLNPENSDAGSLMWSGEFNRNEGEVFHAGGMHGGREGLIKLCVSFILQIAGMAQDLPPKFTICEITDTALRAYRGEEAKKNVSKGGLILPPSARR